MISIDVNDEIDTDSTTQLIVNSLSLLLFFLKEAYF